MKKFGVERWRRDISATDQGQNPKTLLPTPKAKGGENIEKSGEGKERK